MDDRADMEKSRADLKAWQANFAKREHERPRDKYDELWDRIPLECREMFDVRRNRKMTP